IPRPDLIDKVAALQKSHSDRNAKFDEQLEKELFLFLIQPALESIKTPRLLIIPHDELHSLSFQALLNPSDGHFLGERFQISYAPSATVFLGLKQAEPIKQGNLLAIADHDIEAAPMEVEAIAQLYTGRNKVLSASLSTESETT